jgi:hypothetical protein
MFPLTSEISENGRQRFIAQSAQRRHVELVTPLFDREVAAHAVEDDAAEPFGRARDPFGINQRRGDAIEA